MANRKDRRKRPQPVSLPKSQELLLKRFAQNGITVKDLEKNYYLGFDAGRDAATRTCYAAVCLAARDLLKFGPKRAHALLCKMDEHVCDTLSSKEAIDKVFEEMGITIHFYGDPFSHVERVEAHGD
jgi:hypothetical protein